MKVKDEFSGGEGGLNNSKNCFCFVNFLFAPWSWEGDIKDDDYENDDEARRWNKRLRKDEAASI